MRSVGRIKRAFRKVKRRINPGAAILMYHRIGSSPLDPNWFAVSPEHFTQQMEYVRRACRPMRLLELVESVGQATLPRNAVAITFDDGYSDNFHVARPVLEELGLPATIFVTSGYIDSPHEFWWDSLEQMLVVPAQLPPRLPLTIGGQALEWPMVTPGQRQHAFQAVKKLVRSLAREQREEVLEMVSSWSNLERDARPDYRPMSSEEIRQLADHDLIELGAHTVTHPLLSTISAEQQYDEIAGSRQHVEQITGKPVRTFCYPSGNYDKSAVNMVKLVGFEAACTINQGVVEKRSDIFQLPRCHVGDWDLENFKQNLEGCLHT